ncbi:hypothetical protein DPMN_180880 [Dreissena polymorpha]|uniref:POPDC1-3 domain-containing protein n=1 Tax=Dreissena polymorpha TaxID=45954 RepID=A0A9D4I4S7_DREPO|nr:hypothetical protein DPMN_180880 [Dreissena polymorpha]
MATNATVTNASDVETKDHCKDWAEAQHAVFQLARLFILISFLTPCTFRYHSLFLRVMLSCGHILTLIWGAVFVCMPDFVIWCGAFSVANLVHIVYLAYTSLPDRFSKALDDIYLHVFKPLKISRKQFQGLAEIGSMELLGKGGSYAKQDHTCTGLRLSMLLKGRLKVSYDDVYLHSVDVNQFVDSPEYDTRNETFTGGKYKVNIRASEDCLLFVLPQARLLKYLSRDRTLEHIFNQLIGKDISQKLYEIQERVSAFPGMAEGTGNRRTSMVHVRNSIVSNSTTNLANLNCLQGCYKQPSNLSSSTTNESTV